MSYKDRLRYSRDGYVQQQFHITFNAPEKIYDLSRINQLDRYAKTDINILEDLIAELKEYRQDLAHRYSEIAATTYTFKLYLVREKSWVTKKVTYTVRLARVFPDGTEINDLKEVFNGSDRKQAFERFNALKKSRPGIETVQDTQKKQWEK